MPSGSRKATSAPSAIATTEYAPSRRRIVAATASGSGEVAGEERAMTSVSEVDARRTPAATSSSRSGSGSTRFPLWHSATVLADPWKTTGWAFAQRAPPVVEYRVWPIATSPGARKLLLVEHLGDEPHLPDRRHAAALGDGDAC